MSDLIEVEPKQSAALLDLRPADMVVRATEIANVLKDVIKQQKLTVKIGPNEHVKAEGWATMGSMLNVLPKERQVIEHPDGSFEAYVDLVNMRTGVIVGGGSAICGAEEQRWKKAERYARRSMAITRATGKAYRLCFAWVMALAGYNTTPAEEMPFEDEAKKPNDTIEAVEVKAPTSTVYTATNSEKQFLLGVFERLGVAAADRAAINKTLLENKISFPDEIEAAVKEAHADLLQIPFEGG